MSGERQITVAHFRTPFLSLSETFIYGILKNIEPPFHATVFTSDTVNAAQFPFPDIVSSAFRRFSIPWFANGIANHLSGAKNFYWLKQLRARHAKIIHAHFGPQGWELLDLKRRTGLPLVTSFYGYDLSLLSKIPMWLARYDRLFAGGDLFLVEGPQMKEALARLGCPEKKIRLHRIAVDLDRIAFRERAASRGPVSFLFCGRFIEKKGLLYALKAFAALRDEGLTDFKFRVIGDGVLMAEVRNLIGEKNLKDNVELLGYRTQQEFYGELERADVFVAPSVTALSGDTEGGAPTSILEAQAAGLPVIATHHADIPAIVAEGRSALLSAERDVAGLKKNIRTMIEQRALWPEFGRAGRALMNERHNIKKEIKNLESIYYELLPS